MFIKFTKLKRAMKFYHQTSPGIALHLINTQVFSSCLIEGDHGLNGYTDLKQVNGQTLENVGAELVLKWLGDVEEVNADEIQVSDMRANVLYSQFIQTEFYMPKKRWREFVPAPMGEDLLQIVNIRFLNSNKIDQFIHYLWWYKFVPRVFRINLERRVKLKFIKNLRDKYVNNKLFLRIK